MASLKSLLALADDSLREVFAQKPHDPTKARKPVLKSIETTRGQFASATPTRGKKRFSIGNGVVEYRPGMTIEGRDIFYVPSERFNNFLDTLKASVEAGELDEAIKAGEGEKPAGARQTRGPAKGGAWSEARRAAHEARKAEREKAKK